MQGYDLRSRRTREWVMSLWLAMQMHECWKLGVWRRRQCRRCARWSERAQMWKSVVDTSIVNDCRKSEVIWWVCGVEIDIGGGGKDEEPWKSQNEVCERKAISERTSLSTSSTISDINCSTTRSLIGFKFSLILSGYTTSHNLSNLYTISSSATFSTSSSTSNSRSSRAAHPHQRLRIHHWLSLLNTSQVLSMHVSDMYSRSVRLLLVYRTFY